MVELKAVFDGSLPEKEIDYLLSQKLALPVRRLAPNERIFEVIDVARASTYMMMLRNVRQIISLEIIHP